MLGIGAPCQTENPGACTMKMIADGKEAVISHLESQLIDTPGYPGRYMLLEDDLGQLVICIAGCMFIGEGKAVLDGIRLTVRNGVAHQ
jgi:hypothetical protein